MLITIKLSFLNFAESLETPTSFHTETNDLGVSVIDPSSAEALWVTDLSFETHT